MSRASAGSAGGTRRVGGVTLVELVVVLVVLGVLAGLLMANLDQAADKARQVTTAATLDSVRRAILGDPAASAPCGYLADTGALPLRIRDLFSAPLGVPEFEPALGLGWRGPYLATSTGSYAPDAEDLANGFTAHYGDAQDPALLDAWLRPVVLQIPDPDDDGLATEADLLHARLVSAGPDGVLDTPRTDALALPPGNAHFPALLQCDDDLVLYLRVADQRPEPP